MCSTVYQTKGFVLMCSMHSGIHIITREMNSIHVHCSFIQLCYNYCLYSIPSEHFEHTATPNRSSCLELVALLKENNCVEMRKKTDISYFQFQRQIKQHEVVLGLYTFLQNRKPYMYFQRHPQWIIQCTCILYMCIASTILEIPALPRQNLFSWK